MALALRSQRSEKVYSSHDGSSAACADAVKRQDAQAVKALLKGKIDVNAVDGEGMTALRGPTNPSLNYECGLLIEGFDTPPFFMMTHNKPYYPALVEAGHAVADHDDARCARAYR